MKVYRIIVEGKYVKDFLESRTPEKTNLSLNYVSLKDKDEAMLFSEKQTEKIINVIKEFDKNYFLEEAGEIDYCMEYGKKECNVCNKEFELKEENKYIVNVEPKPFIISGLKEAFDCPYCGCQNVVNSYNQKYDNNNKKVSNNENI